MRKGLVAALLMLCLALTACGAKPSGAKVLLDGAAWDKVPLSPEVKSPRVYITLDGKDLIDLPFAEPHDVTILQDDGSENAVKITGEAVYMDHANCENQDCVNMGQVTLDNLELRVMGGFVICLPHKVSVEVRE